MTLSTAAAEAILRSRFGEPVKTTKKVAGFATAIGRVLAVDRERSETRLWFQPSSPPAIEGVTGAGSAKNSNLDGPLKTLSREGTPRVDIENEAALLRFLDWYQTTQTDLDRGALDRLKRKFLARYPDFLPAGFAGQGTSYHREGDDLTRKVIRAFQELMFEGMSRDEAGVGQIILDLLLRGDQNVFDDASAVRTTVLARQSHASALERAIGRLARTADAPEIAAAHFVAEIWPILRATQPGKVPFETSRRLPTVILALARPYDAIAIQYQKYWDAGDTLLSGQSLLANGPLLQAEYASVLHLCRSIFAVMHDEWKWQPRDLFDVRAFILATCDKDKAEPSLSAPEPAVASQATQPTNLILYGPPGTGKTFRTAAEAVRICDGNVGDTREAVMTRYRELCGLGQIAFVTFHQSYSYEEFIEGLRPQPAGAENSEATSAGFGLVPKAGVFKGLCESALASRGNVQTHFEIGNRRIFKMSIGEVANPDHEYLFEEALRENRVLLGWGAKVDWSDAKFEHRDAMIAALQEFKDELGPISGSSGYVKFPFILRNRVQNGDLIVVSKGNGRFRGIAEVIGLYEFRPRPADRDDDMVNTRRVRWLWTNPDGAPTSDIYSKNFVQSSLYEFGEGIIRPVLERYIAEGLASAEPSPPRPFVMIIDEINRANISKVFGELITLIEPDKRIGASNALTVKLPYSREDFGVPANLHIIGTMNTADRSIALLDTALRRRFSFREMLPDASKLTEEVDSVPLQNLLRRLNERIEYLFDREHQIGHACFMGCRTRADIDAVMRDKVIPLLSEYFYEDWSKLALVLGDAEAKPGEGKFVTRSDLEPPPGLPADDYGGQARTRWQVRAPFAADAYDSFR